MPTAGDEVVVPEKDEPGYREGSAVLVVDREGRVLLQQRDDDVPPAGVGRWAIPGGGREGDEHPLATALREFAEETTVDLQRVRHFGTYSPRTDDWMNRFMLHIFLSEDDVPRDAITVLEGLDFRYWPPEEALKLSLNPTTQRFLGEIVQSPLYRAARARAATADRWAAVIALDRWGRALLVEPADAGRPGRWSIPGGPAAPDESPDRAALRRFEEASGHTLETLQLFRAYARDAALPLAPAAMTHIYYYDPDLHIHDLQLPPGATARYVAPEEVETVPLAGYAQAILREFFVSPAYKAMFH